MRRKHVGRGPGSAGVWGKTVSFLNPAGALWEEPSGRGPECARTWGKAFRWAPGGLLGVSWWPPDRTGRVSGRRGAFSLFGDLRS